MVVADDDWRRSGQEAYLGGAALTLRTYSAWSESWDHDHCAFCWAKFVEPGTESAETPPALTEGYTTTGEHEDGAGYHWVCETCFGDFAGEMGWRLEPGP